MIRQRVQPIRGTRWVDGHKKRETPSFIVRAMIRGYLGDWRLISISKVAFSTVIPTNSNVMPLNMWQYRSYGFFDHNGVKLSFVDPLGKKLRGRPPKIKKEFQLMVEIRGYGTEWKLLRILRVWNMPGLGEMGGWELDRAGFDGCVGNRILIEEGLGVPQNVR